MRGACKACGTVAALSPSGTCFPCIDHKLAEDPRSAGHVDELARRVASVSPGLARTIQAAAAMHVLFSFLERCRIKLRKPRNWTHVRVISAAGTVLALYDRSDELGGLTITNAAESIVEELAEEYVELDAMRIVYRDTLGVWDEITHDGARFLGFRSLGGTDDLTVAIERVRGDVQ